MWRGGGRLPLDRFRAFRPSVPQSRCHSSASTSRSSNRAGGFPALGSRTRPSGDRPRKAAPPVAGWPPCTTGRRSPFGPAPFRAFNPTTGYSVPVPHIGTWVLMGITYSDVSCCIEATGSHVPHKSLIRVHAAFKPDAAGAGLQDSAHADPGANTPFGFAIFHTLSARHRSVRFRSSLRISPDRIKFRLFSANAHQDCSLQPQHAVVWSQLLLADPEGPTLISRTAPHLLYSQCVRDTRCQANLSTRRPAAKRTSARLPSKIAAGAGTVWIASVALSLTTGRWYFSTW